MPAVSPPRTAAERNTESRSIELLREAAVRDLDLQRHEATDAEPLPVRSRPLPTRRRAEPPTSGDLNAVMVSIPRTTDAYGHPISESPDSQRAHTTSGAPEKQ